MIYNNKNSKN